MNSCPSQAEIEKYVLQVGLTDSHAEQISIHVASCSKCERFVNDERLFEDLKIVLDETENERSQPKLAGRESESKLNSLELSIDGYEIVDKVYRGGQGIVYKAIQKATKRNVAIKVLLDGLYATDEKRHRFEREIDLVAQLKHPNIVTIYDSGHCDGHSYFSMEFVDGLTLDKYVNELEGSDFKSGATEKSFIKSVLITFLKIGKAVSHAHRHGVIHRDLKPNNIIVDDNQDPKVLDFGLAKISEIDDTGSSHKTMTGEYLGTPAYSSPEQVMGKVEGVDTRSDVYSLGVILFELLTRRFPYSVKGSFVEVANEIREAVPSLPSSFNRNIDDELETIIIKSLAKDPLARYQTVDQLVDDIESYLEGRPIEAKRDSSWYVLRKSIGRYWHALSVVAIILVALSVALLASISFHRQAVKDRDLAKQANEKTGKALKAVSAQRNEAETQGYIAGLAAAAGSIQLYDVAETTKRIQKVPERLRGWEWYHFLHLLDDSLARINIFDRKVTFAAMSSDGKQLVAAARDNSIRLVDVKTQKELYRVERKSFGPVETSADFRWTAYSSDNGSVELLNTDTFEKVKSFYGMGDSPTCIRFSPDGKRLAAGFAKGKDPNGKVGVVIWDLTTMKKIREFPFQFWHVNDIHFSPNLNRIAAITFEGGSIWEVGSGRRLQKLPDRPGMENCICFDSTGKKVFTGGADGVIYCYDLESQNEAFQFKGHRGAITDFEICDKGQKLVSSSRDKTLRVWSLESQRQTKVLKGHSWAIKHLNVINDGKKMVTASWDQSIRIWPGVNAKPTYLVPDAHDDQIIATAFTRKGWMFATTSNDQSIKIWSTTERKLLQTLTDHTAPVHGVAFSPDGRLLATVGWNGQAKLWSTKTWKKIGNFKGHKPQARVHSVVFSNDNQWLVTGASDNDLIVWDAKSLMKIKRLKGHDDHIHAVNITSDNRYIVSAGHRSIKVWNTSDFTLERSIKRKMIQDDFSLAVHPNRNWVAAGADVGIIKLWDIATGDVVQSFEGHSDEINAVEFFPDGSRIISSSFDNSIKLWDTESGRELLTLFGYEGHANTVTFSRDGFYAIAGLENGAIKIWPGATAKELQKKKTEYSQNRNQSGGDQVAVH